MRPAFDALRAAPLLRGVDAEVLADLADRAAEVRVAKGEILCSVGDPGTDLFIVGSGRLRAQIEVDRDVRKTVSQFGAGDHLGEFSFVSGCPRSAEVIAEDDSVLYRISRAAWEAFERAHPGAALAVFRTLSVSLIDRLRRTNEELAGFVRWGIESLRLQGP